MIFEKFSRRTLIMVSMALFGVVGLGGITTLTLMMLEIAPNDQMWLYIGGALVGSFLIALPASLFGYELARTRFHGRPIRLVEMLWSGTILPQNAINFRVVHRQEVGEGIVLATIERTSKIGLVANLLPRFTKRSNIFTVLDDARILPTKTPCSYELESTGLSTFKANIVPEGHKDNINLN